MLKSSVRGGVRILLGGCLVVGACLLALPDSATASVQQNRPLFAVQPSPRTLISTAASVLPHWKFTYTFSGKSYTDAFVGTNPSGGGSTTIPVYVVPVKLVQGTFAPDPLSKLSNGKTVVQNTIDSPLFQSGIDYVQGGTDVGTTQYVDAFQRASLWGTVSSHPTYHVRLGTPTVEPEVTFTVPKGSGTVGTAFGVKVMKPNINWFDAKVQPLLSKLHIPVSSLPIFETTQTYLTQSGCCIGGYHSFNGIQAYSAFTYIKNAGAFAQNVSALSHEIGEYYDDPFTNNTDVPASCGANHIYEVGDPLEGEANYGDYPYSLNGFTYSLQDLVTPVYFGAPASTSVNGWSTFQGTPLGVCQNGG
jgi:hypothetical protein